MRLPRAARKRMGQFALNGGPTCGRSPEAAAALLEDRPAGQGKAMAVCTNVADLNQGSVQRQQATCARVVVAADQMTTTLESRLVPRTFITLSGFPPTDLGLYSRPSAWTQLPRMAVIPWTLLTQANNRYK